MKTDHIRLTSDLEGRTEALREAERFCGYHGLTGKQAMYLRLLTEESISMVNGILNGFEGEFWLESEQTDKGCLCRVCVSASVNVSEVQEEALLSVSSSGQNESARGIMGKVRQMFRWYLQQADAEAIAMSNPMNPLGNDWVTMGMGTGFTPESAAYWSLRQYTRNLADAAEKDDSWDELEKSIVAKIADEVRVGIHMDRAEVIIEKCFPQA